MFSFVINTDSERKLKRENQMYRQMYKSLSAREELVGDVLDGLRVKDNEIYHRLFNSDAPDLGSIYSDGLLSDVDTIPDGLIVEYSRVRLDTLSRISDRVEANFRRVMEALSDRKADLPPMTNPLAGFSYARTGASVGDRINPFYKVKVFHGGLDLISQQGESVVAAADGVVKEVTHSTKVSGTWLRSTTATAILHVMPTLRTPVSPKDRNWRGDRISARSGCPETRSHRIFITRFSRIPCGWIR